MYYGIGNFELFDLHIFVILSLFCPDTVKAALKYINSGYYRGLLFDNYQILSHPLYQPCFAVSKKKIKNITATVFLGQLLDLLPRNRCAAVSKLEI